MRAASNADLIAKDPPHVPVCVRDRNTSVAMTYLKRCRVAVEAAARNEPGTALYGDCRCTARRGRSSAPGAIAGRAESCNEQR